MSTAHRLNTVTARRRALRVGREGVATEKSRALRIVSSRRVRRRNQQRVLHRTFGYGGRLGNVEHRHGQAVHQQSRARHDAHQQVVVEMDVGTHTKHGVATRDLASQKTRNSKPWSFEFTLEDCNAMQCSAVRCALPITSVPHPESQQQLTVHCVLQKHQFVGNGDAGALPAHPEHAIHMTRRAN